MQGGDLIKGLKGKVAYIRNDLRGVQIIPAEPPDPEGLRVSDRLSRSCLTEIDEVHMVVGPLRDPLHLDMVRKRQDPDRVIRSHRRILSQGDDLHEETRLFEDLPFHRRHWVLLGLYVPAGW